MKSVIRNVATVMLVVLAVLGGLGITAMVAGCEPKAVSPYTGLEATGGEIAAQAAREERGAVRAAAEAQDKAAADVREAQRKAAAAVLRVQSERDVADVQTRAELARLKVEQDAAIAEAMARSEAAGKTLAAAVEGIRSSADIALGEIERKRAMGLGVLKLIGDNALVKTAAAGVGVDSSGLAGSLGTLIFGAAGAWGLAKAGAAKKLEVEKDKAFEDGHAAAAAAADEKISAYNKAMERATAGAADAASQERMAKLEKMVMGLLALSDPKVAAPVVGAAEGSGKVA